MLKSLILFLSTLTFIDNFQVCEACPQQVVELVTNIVSPTSAPTVSVLGFWQDWGAWGSSCTPTGMQCSNIRTRDCNTTRCDGQVNNEVQQTNERACTCPALKDCYEHYMSGKRTDAVLSITPFSTAFDVVCDQANGGYIVIAQGIKDTTVDFNRDFTSYANGFGPRTTTDAFWLGNEIVHQLTRPPTQLTDPVNTWEAILELTKEDNSVVKYTFSTFRLGNLAEKYSLHVSGTNSDSIICRFTDTPLPQNMQTLLGNVLTLIGQSTSSALASLINIQVSSTFGLNGQLFQTRDQYQGPINCPHTEGYGFWFRGQLSFSLKILLPLGLGSLPPVPIDNAWTMCAPLKFVGNQMFYYDCSKIDYPISDIKINLLKTRLMIRKKP